MSTETTDQTRREREPLLVHATLVSAAEPNDSIDPRVIVDFLRRNLLLLVALAACGALVAVGISFTADRVYRAELVLEPVSIDDVANGLPGIGARLGGVAGLLGVDLNGGGKSTAASLATLKSRRLLVEFITRNNLLPVLFANRWDATAKKWKVPPEKIPTLEDAYLMFSKDILETREDKKGGLIIVSVDWKQPVLAARWANEIVAETNRHIAAQAAAEAQRNIDFLNAEIPKTDDIGLRQAIFSLVENEIKKGMLARTRVDYAFRVIDPATPPDPRRAIAPKRVLYLLAGLLIGLLAAAVMAPWWERRRAMRSAAS